MALALYTCVLEDEKKKNLEDVKVKFEVEATNTSSIDEILAMCRKKHNMPVVEVIDEKIIQGSPDDDIEADVEDVEEEIIDPVEMVDFLKPVTEAEDAELLKVVQVEEEICIKEEPKEIEETCTDCSRIHSGKPGKCPVCVAEAAAVVRIATEAIIEVVVEKEVKTEIEEIEEKIQTEATEVCIETQQPQKEKKKHRIKNDTRTGLTRKQLRLNPELLLKILDARESGMTFTELEIKFDLKRTNGMTAFNSLKDARELRANPVILNESIAVVSEVKEEAEALTVS